jgi:RNA polymerase sigma factor (sigma-70 family)
MSSRVADGEWVMESAPTGRGAPHHALAVGLARMGDDRLAQLVRDGRERAFAALYERYRQPLYRYCRSLVRSDVDAQDVLQSTFVAAFAALREGRRNAPLRPWLFRIAHNEAVTLLRRRRGREDELSDSLLPAVPSAADQADDRRRMALLVADLAELPERQRWALLMRELSGLSHVEIAVVLETSVGAAKQAIFDARSALMELAEGRAMACDDVRRRVSERDGRVLRGRRLRSHLRECSGCAAFAAAIPARRHDLQAIAPMLPAGASAALFARVARTTSAHGSGGGVGVAATAGAIGKVGGAALVSKTAVAVAIVASVAAGVGGLTKVLVLDHSGGSSGLTTQPAQGAFAGSARRHSTVAPTVPAARHGRAIDARVQSHTGARGHVTFAAGSVGHSTPGRSGSHHGAGSVGAAHPLAGTGVGSLRGASHRGSGASQGQSSSHRGTARHGQSAAQRHGGVSHAAHHAIGPSDGSHRASPHASTGSQTSSSRQQRTGASGSAATQQSGVSPPRHPAPNSTTTTEAPTPKPRSTDGARIPPANPARTTS